MRYLESPTQVRAEDLTGYLSNDVFSHLGCTGIKVFLFCFVDFAFVFKSLAPLLEHYTEKTLRGDLAVTLASCRPFLAFSFAPSQYHQQLYKLVMLFWILSQKTHIQTHLRVLWNIHTAPDSLEKLSCGQLQEIGLTLCFDLTV